MGLRKFAAALMLICLGTHGMAQDVPPPSPVEAPVTTMAGPVDSQTGGAQPLTKTNVDAWLDGFVPYALGTGDVAGAVVVVVKDGQILTSRGFGYANVAKRQPVNPAQTLFRPGSISKLFTWTAVMQLVEQGKLDLDADVNSYLDFEIPPYDGKPVTLRQIMTHTAGFEESAKNLIFSDPAKIVPLGTFLRQVPARIFEPGTTPAYSNYATAVAGYIVQQVSGQPFDNYVEQNIFAPLDMRHSSMRQPLPKSLAAHLATGYQLASGEPEAFEIVGPAPAGSLSATGTDMGRFMIAHLQNGELNGQRILSPETARQMHNTPTDMIPPLNRMELGFYEANINGREVIAHGGDTIGFHSYLNLFLDENTGIFISMNSAGKGGASNTIRTSFFQGFADRYFPGAKVASRVDPKLSVEHALLLAGEWRSSRRFETSFMAIGSLLGSNSVSVDDEGRLVTPFLLGADNAPRKWVEVSPFVWQDLNSHERLAAKLVDGKVTRFSVDSGSPFTVFERVPAGIAPSWLLPALVLAAIVLAMTALFWPVRALVRRNYSMRLDLAPAALRAYQASRAFSWLILLVFISWLGMILAMTADFSLLSSSTDPWLHLLQVAGWIAFVGGVFVMGWNLAQAFRPGRTWWARVWAVCLLIAALLFLWTAFQFNLLSFSVSY